MDLTARIEKHPRVVFRELGEGEGGVLLHLVTGQYYGLNVVGVLVWNLLDGSRTLDDVVAQVRTQVEEAPAALTEDIAAFVQGLKDRDLVQVIEPGRNGSSPSAA